MQNGKQKVLIIDDSPTNIEILNELVGDECEVLFALNGRDGIEMALSEKPDLILLDIMMPEMDGYEVCRKLKDDPLTSVLPVIFITAMSQEEDETKGLEMGAIDYITKPINPPIVKARIKNHLDLKKTRDILEEICLADGLTGIPNRRRFDEYLELEWKRAMRSGTPISLAMVDIDFFKEYNDNYGHIAGDECLKKVARKVFMTVKRPSDLAARYGGEEFACILPETNAEGALRVANALLESVPSLKIPHEYSNIADHVTVSVGVASMLPSDGVSPVAIIEEADVALYAAKAGGRNRVSTGRSEL